MGLGNYIGSALLGMGQGIQQGQQQQQDQAFEQAQRPLLLQAMALKNQSSLLTIQQQQAQLSEDQWLAQDNQSQGINQNDPNAGTQPAPSKPDPSNQGATGAASVLNQPPAAGSTPGMMQVGFNPSGGATKPPATLTPGSTIIPPNTKDRIEIVQSELDQARQQLSSTSDPQTKQALQGFIADNSKLLASLQAKQSPTEKIEAMPVATAQSNIADHKEAAGIPLQPSDHAAVSDSLNQQASRLNAQADRAAAAGHIRLANTLREKAAAFGEKADLAKQREIAVGKTQTADVKEAMSNVDPATMTQEEYNSLRATLGQNPEFVRRVSAKGLTGDIDQDRDQIAKWQHESLGVVKSTELEYKQKDYDLRVQEARRADERLRMEEAKANQEKAEKVTRQTTQTARILSSGELAAADLENLAQGPASANGGVAGQLGKGGNFTGATRNILTNEMSSADTRRYNEEFTGLARNLATIESSGVYTNQTLVDSLGKLAVQPGDTGYDAMRKVAEARQIIEEGLSSARDNPGMTPKQIAQIDCTIDRVQTAIPFKVRDVDNLVDAQKKSPNVTVADLYKQGTDKAAAKPAEAPKEGTTSVSKSGKDMVYRNGQWEYK